MVETVSITIPTKNSAATIGPCIRSAVDDSIPIEVIVADDCSTDGTREIARALGAIVLEGPLPLLEARFRAFEACGGDIVFLIDSDQVLEAGTLRRCIELIKEYDALVLEERSIPGGTWIGQLYAADRRYLHAFARYHLDLRSGSLLPRVFRRVVLDRALSRIPEAARQVAVAQDHAIIGGELATVTDSIGLVSNAIRHHEMDSFLDLWRKYFRWGAGLVALFEAAPQYREMTNKKMRGRLRRGDATAGDFAASLALMSLKAIPYMAGYGWGSLMSRRASRPYPRT